MDKLGKFYLITIRILKKGKLDDNEIFGIFLTKIKKRMSLWLEFETKLQRSHRLWILIWLI